MQERLAWFAWFACLSLAVACGPSKHGADDDDGADGGGSGADAHPVTDAGACTSTSRTADQALAPVDIIWVVDTSGSMNEERAQVQGALNDFSTFIESAGIDEHVILLADPSEMTVPPPLGTNPAKFLHVPQPIESHDSFQHIIDRYPDYQAFLRPGAVVHIVEVTDDESDWSESQFESALAGLTSPGISPDFHFHAICSEETVLFTPPPPLPAVTGPCQNGLGGTGADGVGKIYMDTAAAHDGVWRSICSTDWQPIFDELAQAATVGVELPCTFEIPTPPDNQTLDPDRVNFVYTAGGSTSPVTVPRVDSAADCGSGPGWYYDNPAAPTQILTCPATCSTLEGDPDGQVDIAFGCATVVP